MTKSAQHYTNEQIGIFYILSPEGYYLPGLAICAENTPDIVLMDIRMPGIDGIAAQLYLGEGTVRDNIVVIMEKLGVSNRTQLCMSYYESEMDGSP